MRILFVASRMPAPFGQGDRVRAWHQLRILSRRHAITLILSVLGRAQEADLAAIRPFCEQVEIVKVPLWRRTWNLRRGLWSPLPLQTLWYYDAALGRRARDLARSGAFDLMHVQLARMAPVINAISPHIPSVLDYIDALSVNMARRAQRQMGPVARLAGLEAGRLQSYERELVKCYDQLVISSPLDRAAIGDFANLQVVPNGVDLEKYPFVAGEREPATLIFTGSMGYFPNVDAIMWFVKRVLPLVRKKIPGVRLWIVGSRPARAVRKLAALEGVTVTGYVPRIQDYLGKAAAAIAPMQSGSGMQFKVIEAFACGTPVVATSYGLGGLEVEHGMQLLIADNAVAFAEQLVNLLNDPMLRQRLAANARRLVAARYSWEQSVAALERIYSRAL